MDMARARARVRAMDRARAMDIARVMDMEALLNRNTRGRTNLNVKNSPVGPILT